MHFICNWSCCLLKERSSTCSFASLVFLSGQRLSSVKIILDSCPAGFALICKSTAPEGWSDPWWRHCALTTPEPSPLVQTGVSKMMSPSEGERVTRGRCESSA